MAIESVSKKELRIILGNIVATLDREKQCLSQLDSYIGDGDHGFGIANGFRIGFEKVSQLDGGSIAEYLRTIGLSLVKGTAGASGTLFGSLFLGMAEAAQGHEHLGLSNLCRMFAEGLVQVKRRGKAESGDKTMLDALNPLVVSLRQSLTEGLSLAEACQRAAIAARKGAEETKNMIAKHGRAKYFREKSIGYQDAGATTIALMIESLAQSVVTLDRTS